jgi:DNA-binding HxlR family transcriptional regulator
MQPTLCYHGAMRGVSLSTLHCSIARTLDVVGERWSLLILRDAFNGVRRFEDFAARLPIASNVLTARLQTLVAHGILERHPYQDRPVRHEYRLTDKGRRLYPVLIALLQWGDTFLAGEEGPPLELAHRDCGHPIAAEVVCQGCRQTLTARDIRRKRPSATTSELTPAPVPSSS